MRKRLLMGSLLLLDATKNADDNFAVIGATI